MVINACRKLNDDPQKHKFPIPGADKCYPTWEKSLCRCKLRALRWGDHPGELSIQSQESSGKTDNRR
jgi:hypothetical protein